MRRAIRPASALLLVAVGCGTSEPDPFMKGFTPDKPGAGQIQIYTDVIPNIAPGADITYCSYLDYKTSKLLDVVGYKGMQSSPGGHHNILYAVATPQAPNTHECTEDDMLNVHYLGGGGTDATIKADDLPPGIVFRVQQETQLMIVSHWINASDQTISGQTAYNLTVEDPKPESAPADLFTVVNTMFQVNTGTAMVHSECTLAQGMQVFMLGPHAHEHATHMTLTKKAASDGSVTTIQDIPWTREMVFNTPLVKFTKDAPYTFATGDTYAVDCTYENTTGAPIPFPTEMCVAYGYYFPATHEIDCVDGHWPN